MCAAIAAITWEPCDGRSVEDSGLVLHVKFVLI